MNLRPSSLTMSISKLCAIAAFAILLTPVALWGQESQPSDTTQQQGLKSDQEKPTDPVELEIHQFFEQYAAASLKENADDLVELYDFMAMIDASLTYQISELPDRLRNLLFNQIKLSIKRQFETIKDQWQRHRVLQVKFSADKTIAEVFVRTWDQEGFSSRTLFWLKKGDSWKVYDQMDLRLGLRISVLFGAVFKDINGRQFSNQRNTGITLLFPAMIKAANGETDEAITQLDDLIGHSIPPSLESIRWCLYAATAIEDDLFSAMEYMDKLEAFEPDSPFIDQLKYNIYLQLEDHESTLHYANRFLTRFGDDDDAYYAKGMALSGLGRQDEAIQAFIAGLHDTPESAGLLIQLANSLPSDQKNQIAPFFKAMSNPMDSFESMADALETKQDAAALKALCEVAKEISNEVPNLAYYEGYILIEEGKLEDAIAKLTPSRDELGEDDEDYRYFYNQLICRAAVESGNTMMAYSDSKDKTECFQLLLEKLDTVVGDPSSSNEAKADAEATVAELIKAHLANHGEDPITLQTLGDRCYDAEQFDKAIEYFTSALSHAQDESTRDTLEGDLVDCHIETKSLLQYYQDSKDKQTVYRMIEERSWQDIADLAEIEKLHQINFPDLPQYALAQIKKLYETEKYQEALDACLAVNRDNQQDDYEVYDFLLQIDDYQTVLLARSGKHDEAMLRAFKLEEPKRDLFRAVIYAIRNDEIKFRKAMQLAIGADLPITRDELDAWIKVPDSWLIGLFNQTDSEVDDELAQTFSRYLSTRRLVCLTTEPIPLTSPTICDAADRLGLALSELSFEDVNIDSDNYVCELANGNFLISVQGCQLFLTTRPAKLLNNFDTVWIEANRQTEEAMNAHKAWLAIDIFAWPQKEPGPDVDAIPTEIAQKMIHLTQTLVGDKASVAIHYDRREAVLADTKFFDQLAETLDVSLFNPGSQESELAEDAPAEVKPTEDGE